MIEEKIRKVHKLIDEIIEEKKEREKFVPSKTRIFYAHPVFDSLEVNAVIDTLVDGWLAEGEKTTQFEEGFAKYVGMKYGVVFNSGSSALLLSFGALADPLFPNHLEKGDEVITSALTFPTSLNSIILNGLKPVLVDVNKENYNFNVELVEEMISDKTRGILAMHAFGNPNEMDKLQKLVKEHNLFLVEDACGAHGSTFNGNMVGSFGDAACFSFHGGHAMTSSEGGVIVTNNKELRDLAYSLKTCGLHPEAYTDYSKRTLYTTIGYKMRITEMQAAFALKQLNRLPAFADARAKNFEKIVNGLKEFEDYLELPQPTRNSKPAWFSVPLTVREDVDFSAQKLRDFLEKQNIETRALLGGNVLRQPSYKTLECRATELPNADYFHKNSFYIGCHQGLTDEMIEFVLQSFSEFFKTQKSV